MKALTIYNRIALLVGMLTFLLALFLPRLAVAGNDLEQITQHKQLVQVLTRQGLFFQAEQQRASLQKLLRDYERKIFKQASSHLETRQTKLAGALIDQNLSGVLRGSRLLGALKAEVARAGNSWKADAEKVAYSKYKEVRSLLSTGQVDTAEDLLLSIDGASVSVERRINYSLTRVIPAERRKAAQRRQVILKKQKRIKQKKDYAKAKSLYKSGQPEQALALFDELRKDGARFFFLNHYRKKTMAVVEERVAQLSMWRNLSANHPTEACYHAILGEQYYQRSYYREAIAAFEAALRLERDYLNADVLLARAMAATRENEDDL